MLRTQACTLHIAHCRFTIVFPFCFRGWAPKVTSLGISHVVSQKFDEFWPVKAPKDKDKPTPEEVVDGVTRQAAERMACLIVTHPLHVCTVRAVAQFVGKEDKYDGVLGALVAIYREDGILGKSLCYMWHFVFANTS